MMAKPLQRTIVYVDGFNLYYGALKDRPYRWLNLETLCRAMLREAHDIVGIKYFTARVLPRPGQEQQPVRQQIYLRALETVPCLSIHYGNFLTHEVRKRLVKPPKKGSKTQLVWNTEEKGSDVNLASHLLIDGFRARYDTAVVISNDSDLQTPIEFVRHDLKAPVGVLNPHENRSWALSPHPLPKGSFYKAISPGVLRASQFPRELEDTVGKFRKPTGW
jgi:uncharacterized LabA/DUF88 family protein